MGLNKYVMNGWTNKCVEQISHCLIISSEMESSRQRLFCALTKSQTETRMLVPEALTPGGSDSLLLSTCLPDSPKEYSRGLLIPLLHMPDNSRHHSLLLLGNADRLPRITTVVCAHILSILHPAFLAALSPSLVAACQWLSLPGSSQFVLSSMQKRKGKHKGC